jgi:hypothetical protein
LLRNAIVHAAFSAATAGALLLMGASSASASPFSYAGPAEAEVDNSFITPVTLTISDTRVITSLNISILTNDNFGDNLTFYLYHSGILVSVFEGLGDSDFSFIDATFSDGALATAPVSGTVAGTFRPVSALSAFNGVPLAGDWELRVTDNVTPGDGTNLLAWNISGDADAAATPEPASIAMASAGVAAIAFFRRRRP